MSTVMKHMLTNQAHFEGGMFVVFSPSWLNLNPSDPRPFILMVIKEKRELLYREAVELIRKERQMPVPDDTLLAAMFDTDKRAGQDQLIAETQVLEGIQAFDEKLSSLDDHGNTELDDFCYAKDPDWRKPPTETSSEYDSKVDYSFVDSQLLKKTIKEANLDKYLKKPSTKPDYIQKVFKYKHKKHKKLPDPIAKKNLKKRPAKMNAKKLLALRKKPLPKPENPPTKAKASRAKVLPKPAARQTPTPTPPRPSSNVTPQSRAGAGADGMVRLIWPD